MIFLFLFVFSINLNGQAKDYQSLAGKTYGDRQLFLLHNFYLNYELRADSIKYFGEVNKLKKVAENANDEELLLETELLKFNYLSSRKYKNYLPEILQLLKKADEKGITHLQARIRQAIGLHYFYERNNYGEAYIYLADSYSFIEKLSLLELPDKQELLYNIGFVNYSIGYDSKALKYLEEAQELTNQYYSTLENNIVNTRGLIYQQSGNLDEALKTFHKSLEISNQIKNDIWISVSKNSIANILIIQNKFPEALEYLNDNPKLSLHKSEEEGIVEVQRLMLLSKVYAKEELWGKLSVTADLLRDAVKRINLPLRTSKEIYPLLALDQKQKGNYERAFLYIDTALNLNIEYNELKNDEGLRQTIEKERIEILLQQQTETKHQEKLKWLTAISLTIILLLVIVLAILLFKRQKEIFRKKKELVESELDESRGKIAELLNDLMIKDKEVTAFEDELDLLRNQNHNQENEPAINQKEETLEALLSKPIMTDNKWIMFKRAFDKIYKDYYLKLQTEIPQISPAEVRYMYLRKLNLTPKEIAYMLGISQSSIRQYKYRIRAKINLSADENIDEFLDNLGSK